MTTAPDNIRRLGADNEDPPPPAEARRLRLRSIAFNVFALGGLGSLAIGCWWVYPPSALIVVGVILLGAARMVLRAS